MTVPSTLQGRYEIRELLGQGGLGAVYRAYDNVVRREVALRTLHDAPARAALEKFFEERDALVSLNHPFINEIFETGEYEEDGRTKPFFITRLISGVTLERLIRNGSQRLTIHRAVEILCRTCRALNAAHERGLVHGGIKPGCIFVTDEDAVKIADFGVAYLVAQGRTSGIPAALPYRAPELIEGQALSPAADIFALGAVAYEAFTGRRAFDGATEAEIAGSIRREVPPAASDINAAVGQMLSRAVHKAMAKQPQHRYSNASEFADTLTQALRNEPIAIFSSARIQPRIEQAQKSFEAGDVKSASDALTELESEGHIDPAMTALRRQIGLAMRSRAIGTLLESARAQSERGEYPLALESIRQIFEIDRGNAQALALRANIEKLRAGQNQVEAPPPNTASEPTDENTAEAEKLVAQGKALCAQQWFEEGLAMLRKALALTPENRTVRAALVDALVERARVLLETDWRAAEPFIQQAGELDPANSIVKNLRTTAADHKRDETVVQCFTRARQLRAAGDLESALKEAEACYAEYPLDPRLQQLRDILTAEIAKTRSKERPEDLETLTYLELSAAACPSHKEVAGMLERAREIAARYPGDSEFCVAVSAMEGRLAKLAPEPPDEQAAAATHHEPPTAAAPIPPPPPPPKIELPPALPAPVPPAPQAVSPLEIPAPVPLEPEPFAPPPAAFVPGPPIPVPAFPNRVGPGFQADAPPPPLSPVQQPATPPARKKPKHSLVWIAAGALGMFVVLFGVVFALKSRNGAAPGTVAVQIRTTPAGATIRIDGKVRGTSDFELVIAPGKYQLEALIEGYQPAAVALDTAAGPVALTLQPVPHAVRIVTDLPDGAVTIDDQPARELQDGQAVLDAVPPGAHTVKITSKAGEAVLALDVSAGRAPALTAPPSVKNLAGLVVSNLGGNAQVYTTLSPAKVDLDGQTAGDATPQGIELRNLAPGTHEIAASDGRTQIRKTVEVSGAPSLTAFFQSDQNIGTILVLAGEDGAQVHIDGKPWRRVTSRGGQLRIPREPKEYRVRVTKSGFEDVPEQVVQIAKGEEKKLVFKLVPKPTTARLHFAGATPGAQVYLDGRELGTVGPDGTFQAGSVPPGEHALELRSGKQRSRAVRKSFVAGQTVELAAADVAVRSSNGSLRLNVTPAGAQVTVVRTGGGNVPVTGALIEVEEGSYTVSARAPGYAPQSTTVQVAGGQTAQASLALVREKPKVVVGRMEGWEKPWKQDGDWFARKGGGAVLYKAAGAGTYAFNLMLSAGGGVFRGKDLEWIGNWVDSRNYILYRLEKDGFRRIVFAGGKKTEYPKRPHGLDLKQVMATVQMEVTQDAIVNRLKVGEKWVVVDAYSPSGADLTAGRFGINIQGNDELRLSGFGFYPKE